VYNVKRMIIMWINNVLAQTLPRSAQFRRSLIRTNVISRQWWLDLFDKMQRSDLSRRISAAPTRDFSRFLATVPCRHGNIWKRCSVSQELCATAMARWYSRFVAAAGRNVHVSDRSRRECPSGWNKLSRDCMGELFSSWLL